jgi:hypothetical protein
MAGPTDTVFHKQLASMAHCRAYPTGFCCPSKLIALMARDGNYDNVVTYMQHSINSHHLNIRLVPFFINDVAFNKFHSSRTSTGRGWLVYSCCSHLEHRASVKRFLSLQFLHLRHSVGLLGRVISPSQGRYLTQTQNKHRHPRPELDWNPRSQRSSERS